ncbi:hypothetical protein FEM48_Zijuj01G0313700 [Ziziphus jujuba var. spinosa]|uniref:NAD-dependent epimerase/dehydratase domain-containing protein n=1 Tax=Ziziphus jujuba var. spinosa TaxID=714518 RepID=A0A978W688_ZIZJJ|nr:hypothetical protein FEM48_Zijuj01G0313700 [Ziziphus jujuba var. spinosa]
MRVDYHMSSNAVVNVCAQTVCVTGAGGFVASGIVELLLRRGYTVKGTSWKELKRLTLCKADLLDIQSLKEAIYGCKGVFHTACPISNDPEQVVKTAVNGTENVIIAAAEAKVGRVVYTSSIGTVYMDPNKSPDAVTGVVIGAMLQPRINTSMYHILQYLTGSTKTYVNSVQAYVHVKDLALGHILVYETPSASAAVQSIYVYY